MPLDPDILLWILKSKPDYLKRSYSLLNTRHSFEQVHQYAVDQARRQIFYFSHLFRKGSYSKKQLEEKMEPYMTVANGRRVFARVLRHDSLPVIGQRGEIINL